MKRLLGAVAVATAVSMTSWVGVAAADPAEDVQIMLGNLPDAIDELVLGVENAVDVLAATQSLVDAYSELSDALVAAGSDLVAGTTQFGALGFGLTLFFGGIEGLLAPYLNAIDDPATAGSIIDPNDLALIGANLPAAIDALLYGCDGCDMGLRSGLVQLLQGNLVEASFLPGLGQPAFLGDALNGTLGAVSTLVNGTDYFNLVIVVLVPMLVLGGVLEGPLVQLEDGLAPLFAALDPVTAPIVTALEGL